MTATRAPGLHHVRPCMRRPERTTPADQGDQHGEPADHHGGTPMSKLAQELPTADQVTAQRVRKGPTGACDIYGDGDLEDWGAVERLRLAKTWAVAQRTVDKTAGVKSIDENKFRYHWRRKCWHWTEEQRQVALEDIA